MTNTNAQSKGKRRRAILVWVLIVGCIALLVLGFPAIDNGIYYWRARQRLKTNYPDYLRWRENGGPFQRPFYDALMCDPERESLISGLCWDQIRGKFPTFVDGDSFTAGTYKRSYLDGARRERPELKVLWFDQEDHFDFCVEMDHAGLRLLLIKG
jgi:hypothetical protein